MNEEIYDVLIIGAGPAGSFAAERLAAGGARVALFDGRLPTEAKACGGGVTSKALKAWPVLLEAMGQRVDEVEMYAPSGKGIRVRLREPFAIYSRRALDSFLRERARRAGVYVFAERVFVEKEKTGQENWTVCARTSDAPLRWKGKILCAADGANSPIARQFAGKLAPSEMEVAFGYRAPLPREEATSATVVAFLPGWAGYAWAFPRLDHISFGIATSQDAFDHASLDAMLWKFMVAYYRDLTQAQKNGERQNLSWNLDGSHAKTAEIEAKLRSTAERYAARIPGLAPTTWDTRRVAGKNWALLGDAAGFADPVTGEGIYYALRSAELFAEAYLRGDAASYEKSWREDFGGELRRAAEMRRKFYGDFLGAPFTERMIQFAGAHRGIRRTLGELIAGEQGYMNLKSTLARSLFIY